MRKGHAIAAYSDRYTRVEREAREAKRGMWAHAHNFDPGVHRHREAGRNYSPRVSKVRSGRNRRRGADGKGLNP